MTTLTTRIFKNGNSQAVRIPQEFRLSGTQKVELAGIRYIQHQK